MGRLLGVIVRADRALDWLGTLPPPRPRPLLAAALDTIRP
jgi:hypothetical protein